MDTIEVLDIASPKEDTDKLATDAMVEPVVLEDTRKEETTALASPLEANVHKSLKGLVAGDLAALPLFVPLLFAFFEDGIRPGMGSRELSMHLSKKATFVLGSLFRMTADAEQKQDETVASRRLFQRSFDFCIGACFCTPAWKVAVIYAADAAVELTTMSLVFMMLSFSMSIWQYADPFVYAAVFVARRSKYATVESTLAMCAAVAACVLMG